ncbi:MAG: ABC transporter ATP-binding protein [Candidatus Riflebacteria bacterium]|nr:ABC transporter ATP-binding protein [Candidatus Riflebacteria bacterium]
MLSLQNVSKHYSHRGKVVKALDNVSVEISQGEFVSIVGPSGSGKSTFLLMLGGMLSPTLGKIAISGELLYDLTSESRALFRRKNVGFLFQSYNLIPYLTALENVQVPLFLTGLSPNDQKEKATQLLTRVGLAERLDHKPSELSGGQQQRVALARMLTNSPKVILADEPTGNLDPETSEQILNFLEEIHKEGHTILMVTHDPRASKRATSILRLAEGKIV